MSNQLTSEELREYSKEHLWYEVWMLFCVGRLLVSTRTAAASAEAAQIVRFAMLEAFVLHLRNVLDFFYSEPRKTDVTEGMFFNFSALPQDFPLESEILKKAHRRAHKEVSHLTTERLPPGSPEKNWNFSELMKEIKPLVEKFCQSASHNALHPEFINQTAMLWDSTSAISAHPVPMVIRVR